MIPKPEQPAWKGPYPNGPQSGITQSLLTRFMNCPFLFYLYAYCGLKDPKPPHDNLPWGSTIHKGLEHYIRGDSLHDSMQALYTYHETEYPSRDRVEAYTAMEMLRLYDRSSYDSWQDLHTEYLIEEEVAISPQRIVLIRGLIDVAGTNRICDHKAKGRIYPQETMEELGEDFQMNVYAKMHGAEYWQYDLIQCPLTAYACPNRIPGYSAQAYAYHIFNKFTAHKYHWPIKQFVPYWLSQLTYFQSILNNQFYYETTILPQLNRLCDWWEYVTHPNFDPNNKAHYNTLFYKMPIRLFMAAKTDKYKGDYYEAVTQMVYNDLVPVTSFFSELE